MYKWNRWNRWLYSKGIQWLLMNSIYFQKVLLWIHFTCCFHMKFFLYLLKQVSIEFVIFSLTIWRIGRALILIQALVAHFGLIFECKLVSSKLLKGMGLKLHTFVWRLKERSLFMDHNSNMDSDSIIGHFETKKILHYPG
jgi:hypothetical protein